MKLSRVASQKPEDVNAVFVLEMTKQTEACLVRVGDDMSHIDQLVTVESKSTDFRTTALKALLDFQKDAGRL